MDVVRCRPLRNQEGVLVEVFAPLEGAASTEFSRLVRDLVYGTARWIVLDVASCPSLDSRAIAALLLAQQICARRDGRVVLLHPTGGVLALLGALGLSDRFVMTSDEAEAFALVGHEGASVDLRKR